MRAFLLNYLLSGSRDTEIDIGKLHEISMMSSSRLLIDEFLGIDSTDLTDDEIDDYRPEVYLRYAQHCESSKDVLLMKAHDAYIYLTHERPIIPAKAISKVIYVVRNPLDITISYAHYANKSIDETIDIMNNQGYCLVGTQGLEHLQIRQRLLTWGQHVLSWVKAPIQHLLVVRYEDMSLHTYETFTQVIEFIKGEVDHEQLDKAIQRSSFETLKQQELDQGFSENLSVSQSRFFRQGQEGVWKNELTQEQIDKVTENHYDSMYLCGYLDESLTR